MGNESIIEFLIFPKNYQQVPLWPLQQCFSEHWNIIRCFKRCFSHFSIFINDLKKKLYSPFLWLGFNFLKATVPLRGDSLLFTIKSSRVPGAHLIDLRGMKGWVELGVTQWYLPLFIKKGSLHNYADDSTLFESSRDAASLI